MPIFFIEHNIKFDLNQHWNIYLTTINLHFIKQLKLIILKNQFYFNQYLMELMFHLQGLQIFLRSFIYKDFSYYMLEKYWKIKEKIFYEIKNNEIN